MMKHIVFVAGLLAALLPLQAEAAAGRFQFVSGEVKVTSAAGKERIASKGDEVNQGDTITTSRTASAQVKMMDDGLIIVRPDTRLRITTFRFNGKADGSERSLISLVKGGFRAITGMIGRIHKDNYTIETPTATIGIRGTDHEPMFIPNPEAGQVASFEPGTYDKVNSGAAVLSTAKGLVVINPNQAGFVPNIANAVPKMLSHIPRFYRAPTNDEPKIIPEVGLKNGTTGNRQPGATSPLIGRTGVISRGLPASNLTIARPATGTLVAPTTLNVAPLATSIQPALTTPTTLQVAPLATTPQSLTIQPAIQPATTIQPITTIQPTTTIQPITTFSDRRLKMNIKQVGTHRLGFGIYEFDYIWGEHAVGVMADEVKLVMPEAVIRDPSGFDKVDYSKLN